MTIFGRRPTLVTVLGVALAMGLSCTHRPLDDQPGAAATVRAVSQQEALSYATADAAPLLLDVRSEDEFAAGHVPGAINIPHTALVDRLGELEAYKQQGLVVYCRSGRRAGLALDVLTGAGFTNLGELEGHMLAWSAEGLPVAQ